MKVNRETGKSRGGFFTYDSVMKQAQVEMAEVPTKAILVDESQDLTECQVDWLERQRCLGNGKLIYFVGDAAQTIYYFRGARSKFLRQIPDVVDLELTTSFRFGPPLAAVANLILFAKEHSPQGDDFVPYRVLGGASVADRPAETFSFREGTVSAVDGMLRAARNPGTGGKGLPGDGCVTLLAWKNITLIQNAIELLMHRPGISIAVYGVGESSAKRKYAKACDEVKHVYDLYMGTATSLPFAEFKDEHGQPMVLDYNEYIAEVEDRELQRFHLHNSLVANFGALTMEEVEKFKSGVLQTDADPSHCDVLLSTIHSAKGAEWANVVICSDLLPLARFRVLSPNCAEFAWKPTEDDYNYW
jgi:superfamily I DNA/RNA helicase